MLIMLFRPLIAIALLWAFILGLTAATANFAQDDGPLLYLTDYNHMDDFYVVLDVETGKTHRIQHPPDYNGARYNYGGECCYEEQQEITSPHDESIRFVIQRDFDNQTSENVEQLYRVRTDDQLEHILSGEYIYITVSHFTDNERYLYIFEKSGSGIRHTLYTLYRYGIQSTELSVVALDVSGASLNCRDSLCQLISGMPDNEEESSQTLFLLNKDNGELRELATADEITIHYWWRENELLYTAYHGDGRAQIHTFNIETDQHRTLSEIEGQGIQSIAGVDWLMVAANSPDDNSIFDIYIVNNLDDDPTTYPLSIQTNNATWLPFSVESDGSLLMIISSPQNNRTSDLYIINNVETQPSVDQLTSTDFNAPTLREANFNTELDDSHLLRVEVGDDEWRYYMLHVPTRTITQLATFTTGQRVMQTQFSEDKNWLALSIEESGQYYVTLVPMDGSQRLQTWDVETESYVCLLSWYTPDSEPALCDLYFGMG